MRKRITILTLIGMAICSFIYPVSAEDRPPVAPDMAQYALNLMAVECQNLSDFAGQAAQNNFGNFDSVKSQFEVAISNFNYLIGPFIPEFIQEFNSAYQNFEPSVSSAQQAAQICQNIRTNTYQKMAQYNGILNPPQDIDTFEKCEQAGYFISGDTCFIGGEYILDKKGYLIGIYNASCFVGDTFYGGTCWYCVYGNDENGCLERRDR